MARRTIEYKGYHGSIEVNTEDFSLYGAILFIEESLTYKGESFEELEAAFRQAVAGHIKSCKDKGEEPPFNE